MRFFDQRWHEEGLLQRYDPVLADQEGDDPRPTLEASPFYLTGFPDSWKTWLLVITGLVIIYIGALLLKHSRERQKALITETKTGTFTETAEHSL